MGVFWLICPFTIHIFIVVVACRISFEPNDLCYVTVVNAAVLWSVDCGNIFKRIFIIQFLQSNKGCSVQRLCKEVNGCMRNHVTSWHGVLLSYSSHLPLKINSEKRTFSLAAAQNPPACGCSIIFKSVLIWNIYASGYSG